MPNSTQTVNNEKYLVMNIKALGRSWNFFKAYYPTYIKSVHKELTLSKFKVSKTMSPVAGQVAFDRLQSILSIPSH